MPQTHACFGRHYPQRLSEPAGDSHRNIRQFIGTGWSGLRFEQPPLRIRPAVSENGNTEGAPA